jgi:voltage-gated potassium channel
MEWLLRRRFLALLVALLMLLIIYPVLHDVFDAQIVVDVLVTLVFLAALQVVFTRGHLRALALLLGIPTLVGVWTGYFLPGLPRMPLAITFHVLAVLFFAFTIATILRAIHRESSVSADSIYGAFCGYFLAGMAFGHLYCVIELAIPGSFRGDADFMTQLQTEHHRHFLLSYFSFITLTTVGYGDVVPARATARALAVVEAILGQFYIAVLLAELIGKRVAQALTAPPSDSPGQAGRVP